MASLGHIAVGLAVASVRAGRPLRERRRLAAALLWSLLSLLPDLDVIGFSLGVEYGDEWGHRGATHSIVFSVAVAAVVGAAALPRRRRAGSTAFAAALVLVSHALLDTLTDGGLGCALFWPFDLTRYFAPWTPIPVAPIGVDFLSASGLYVAVVEAILFAPLFWLALSPAPIGRLTRASLLCTWMVAAWLVVSHDPLRERMVGLLLREDTQLSAGFSDRAMRSIGSGLPAAEVLRQLGPPLREILLYRSLSPADCQVVILEADLVESGRDIEGCHRRGIVRGAGRADVARIMGAPERECWAYSRSAAGGCRGGGGHPAVAQGVSPLCPHLERCCTPRRVAPLDAHRLPRGSGRARPVEAAGEGQRLRPGRASELRPARQQIAVGERTISRSTAPGPATCGSKCGAATVTGCCRGQCGSGEETPTEPPVGLV
jgi:inner membrane protein